MENGANRVQVKIGTVVSALYLDMRLDEHGTWVATVKGHPGCIGDGTSKEDAIRNAVCLYLHLLIMRMHRNRWTPQILKQDEDDLP